MNADGKAGRYLVFIRETFRMQLTVGDDAKTIPDNVEG